MNTPFSSLDPSPSNNRLYSQFYQATENGDASFISNDQIRTITDSAQKIETIDINSTEAGIEQKTALRSETGQLILKNYLDGDASLVTSDNSNIETTVFNKSDTTLWGLRKYPRRAIKFRIPKYDYRVLGLCFLHASDPNTTLFSRNRKHNTCAFL